MVGDTDTHVQGKVREARTPRKAVIQEERKMQQIKSAKSRDRSDADPVISTHRTTAPNAGRTTTKSPGEVGWLDDG